jgi:hypothetical protein
MKQQLIKAIVKMFTKAFALTAIIAAVIGVLGYVKQWDSSLKYSNAFFVAGCLMIIAGASSRYAASQSWERFQLISTESLQQMSSSERVRYIIETSSPVSTVILGVLTGILLISISAVAAYLL